MMFDSAYMSYKRQYFQDDTIMTKNEALRGVLIPTTIDDTEKMLIKAGFKFVRFYQALNFVGWVCTKH